MEMLIADLERANEVNCYNNLILISSSVCVSFYKTSTDWFLGIRVRF